MTAQSPIQKPAPASRSDLCAISNVMMGMQYAYWWNQLLGTTLTDVVSTLFLVLLVAITVGLMILFVRQLGRETHLLTRKVLVPAVSAFVTSLGVLGYAFITGIICIQTPKLGIYLYGIPILAVWIAMYVWICALSPSWH